MTCLRESVAVINTVTEKQFGEGRVYFSLQFIFHCEGKSGQEFKVGTKPEAAKEQLMQACSS